MNNSGLGNNLDGSIQKSYNGDWSEIPMGEIMKNIWKEKYMQDISAEIEEIEGEDSGSRDTEFKTVVMNYFKLCADNVWGETFEDDVCSSVYKLQVSIYSIASEETMTSDDIELIQSLDIVLDTVKEDLEQAVNIEDIEYISRLAELSFFSKGEDDEE